MVKIFDGDRFKSPTTEFLQSPEGTLELGLGNSGSSSALVVVWGCDGYLFEFGEKTPTTDVRFGRLLIGRQAANEVLSSIGDPDGVKRFDIMCGEREVPGKLGGSLYLLG